VHARQPGGFVICTADFDAMTALLTHVTEDCCGETIRCDIPAYAPGTLIGQHRRAKGALA